MVITSVVRGSILNATEKVIAQQNNCVTIKTHGLSEIIAVKWTYANPYACRKSRNRKEPNARDIPGTIAVCKSSLIPKLPTVLCLFAQYLPGKSGAFTHVYGEDHKDSPDDRLKYFAQCLKEVESKGFDDIAIPYRIGCGMAGGEWPKYRKLLKDSSVKFIIYQTEVDFVMFGHPLKDAIKY